MSVRHWSERVRETIIRRTSEGALHLRIRGGAEDGAFPPGSKISFTYITFFPFFLKYLSIYHSLSSERKK